MPSTIINHPAEQLFIAETGGAARGFVWADQPEEARAPYLERAHAVTAASAANDQTLLGWVNAFGDTNGIYGSPEDETGEAFLGDLLVGGAAGLYRAVLGEFAPDFATLTRKERKRWASRSLEVVRAGFAPHIVSPVPASDDPAVIALARQLAASQNDGFGERDRDEQGELLALADEMVLAGADALRLGFDDAEDARLSASVILASALEFAAVSA